MWKKYWFTFLVVYIFSAHSLSLDTLKSPNIELFFSIQTWKTYIVDSRRSTTCQIYHCQKAHLGALLTSTFVIGSLSIVSYFKTCLLIRRKGRLLFFSFTKNNRTLKKYEENFIHSVGISRMISKYFKFFDASSSWVCVPMEEYL